MSFDSMKVNRERQSRIGICLTTRIGDGEPDEDFPALDRHRTLKQFGNVTECCLCTKKGATPPAAPASSPPPSVANKDPISVSHSTDLHLSSLLTVSLQMNMITIQLPNVGHVKLRLEPTTTARDLLPQIAKKHRIRSQELPRALSCRSADYTPRTISSPCPSKTKHD
jgi:hypothetical protein